MSTIPTTRRARPRPSQLAARPLTSVSDLLAIPLDPEIEYNRSSVDYKTYARPQHRPHHLVCHDYAGGYGTDSLWQGCDSSDNYHFYNWSCVDVFVYFSHHRVTIPPPSWIDAAHTNGVKVLGTFITEWDEGEKECDVLLENIELAVDNLVRLAQAYGFEGWLINIENKLNSATKVTAMLRFVDLLTTRLHEAMPHGLIIWYDAVTIEGELEWQNALNDLNKPFLDVSDGIFLNYRWLPEYVTASAALAAPHPERVFFGTDVFGRGTYGGGGLNTHEGVTVSTAGGCSAAVFAPGWTFETHPHAEFRALEEEMWQQIQRPVSWDGGEAPLPVIAPVIVRTTFDVGVGRQLWREGAVVRSRPWTDLSMQSLQPLQRAAENAIAKIMTSPSWNDSYTGGSALDVTVTFSQTTELRRDDPQLTLALLALNHRIARGYLLHISLVYREAVAESTPSDINVQLVVHLGGGRSVTLSDTSGGGSASDLLRSRTEALENGWRRLSHVVPAALYTVAGDDELVVTGLSVRFDCPSVSGTRRVTFGELTVAVLEGSQDQLPPTRVPCTGISVVPIAGSPNSGQAFVPPAAIGEFDQYRFEILSTRGPNAQTTQLTLLRLFDINDSDVAVTGKAESNGSSPAAEGPGCAIDGQLTTKWLDFGRCEDRPPVLTVRLSAAVRLRAYQLVTGNDCPERDPTSWRLSGRCGEEGEWVVLDERSAQSPPWERLTAVRPCVLGEAGFAEDSLYEIMWQPVSLFGGDVIYWVTVDGHVVGRTRRPRYILHGPLRADATILVEATI